ncbi:MAG: TolC family protein, partial [Bacteroidales bacterium]|nr:TolC family protein [Bacteroidales bacterium]
MKRITIVCLIAISLLINISITVAQQETLLLTLDDALNIAKSRSADAMIAKHRFRMNYWEYRSFKADYLPSVNLDASLPGFSRAYQSVRQNDGTYEFQYNTSSSYFANMSIDQKVGFTGGSVYLRSDLLRQDDFYDDSIATNFRSTPVIIGYSQPIFQFN